MAVEAQLKVADLTPEQLAKFSWWRCDQLYEKHESWGNWESDLQYNSGQFVDIGGKAVLLPHLPEDPSKLLVDDYSLSDDQRVITIFLRDYTFVDDPDNPDRWDDMSSGYVAICYQPQGESFYVAVVYHSRYVVPGPMKGAPGSDWYRAK